MKFRFFALLLCGLIGLGHSPARAEAMLVGDSRVPFSADRIITFDNKTYTGRLYATPGHQRHEQEVNGLHLVAILSAERQRAWLILAEAHIYADFDFPLAVTDYANAKLLGAPIGTETIAGLRATKYRLDHHGEDGSGLDGFLWMNADGIVLKLDGTFSPSHGKPVHAAMELSNIHQGPQDQALFDLPKNATKLPPEALQPWLGMKTK